MPISKFNSRIAALACLLFLGCVDTGGPDERLPVHGVIGSVFAGGEPAVGAKVTLHPDGGPAAKAGLYPHGTVDESGSFTLTSYVEGDGAPAGEYRITIIWPDRSYVPKNALEREELEMGGRPPDKLHGRFSDADRSKLPVTITQQAKQVLPRIDLP